MKKSAGRKERRRLIVANRKAAGRKRAKENTLRQRHPKSTKTNVIESED